jgi:endonuclease/exonuclease/phosphatase family metal-dependent hydrolase
MRLLVCALAFLASCQPATDSATTESRLTVSGKLQNADIDEASGLAPSRRDPDILWAINDDGPAVLYAIDPTGATRGKTRISNANNRDWEDLASFTLQDTPYILIADIGDNEAKRKDVTLYVIEEPDLDNGKVKIAWEFDFRYPDGPRDAEAIAVDAANERIIVMSKRDIPAVLYELPLRPIKDKDIVAKRIGVMSSLPQPRRQDVTSAPLTDNWYWQPSAMDIKADGSAAIVVTYEAVYYYPRAANQDWQDALSQPPYGLGLGRIKNVEAVAFSDSGDAAFITAEQQHAPLLRVDLGGGPEPTPAITVMTFNVENLFDTNADPGKHDETYLRYADKRSESHIAICNEIAVARWRNQCLDFDWTDAVIDHKLAVLAETIRQVSDGRGADIIALQEVENVAILERLRNEHLADSGYLPAILIEGQDIRGIDVAFLSRLPLAEPAKLHPLVLEDYPDRVGDTRGVLEATFELRDGSLLTGYSVHFPAPFHPTEMRELAYDHLNGLRASLPADRNVFAAGDFNTTGSEDRELGMLERYVRPFWEVAHDRCQDCPGTQYYAPDDSWSFLDMILFSPKRGEKTTWQIRAESVRIANRYAQQVTEDGTPLRFDPDARIGVSDHWPVELTLEPMQKQ